MRARVCMYMHTNVKERLLLIRMLISHERAYVCRMHVLLCAHSNMWPEKTAVREPLVECIVVSIRQWLASPAPIERVRRARVIHNNINKWTFSYFVRGCCWRGPARNLHAWANEISRVTLYCAWCRKLLTYLGNASEARHCETPSAG